MTRGPFKTLAFRIFLWLTILFSLEIAGYIGLRIYSHAFDILANKSYLNIRAMLMGDPDSKLFPRYLSLPHLGYIPYPGYIKYNIVQHNEDGYRGQKVAREKGNKFRVLCMGGSTTYGFGVDSPWKAYPAQLEIQLNNYINSDSALKQKYSGAEVINAGIDAGTSAEELQQYLFKYRYYHADAVVVHSGINDAMLTVGAPSNFQFDYTDSRRLAFHLEPLPQPMRFLMHSYFVSFVTIHLFYRNFAENGGRDEFKHNGNQTFVNWSNIHIDSVLTRKQYGLYPFYQNSKSLYSSIVQDSSALIVLPNFLNKNSAFVIENEQYDSICSLNIMLTKLLTNEFNGIFIPFSFKEVSNPVYWYGDDCHLTKKGENIKAKFLLPYIKHLIHQSSKK